MTYAAFTLALSGMLVLMAVMASWLFRAVNAPLWQSLMVMALAVVTATVAPWQVSRMMGFPSRVEFDQLPDRAEFLGYIHERGSTLSYLWLRVGLEPPRAYEISLDDGTKDAISEGEDRKSRGERTMFQKRRGKNGSAGNGGNQAATGFEVDYKSFNLPPKDAP